MNLAVFVSGRGSNLQAILDSRALKDKVYVKAVISNKSDCAAFQIAGKYSIPTISLGDKDGSVSYEDLSILLKKLEIDFLVLAGFLKLIPNNIISKYHNKIINVHPALLPAFGGKGMYGMNVHRAVFNSSAKVSGVTVHFVDPTFDTGRIIAQKCVDISEVKSPEEIAEKVLEVEHKLLPFVIEKFAEDKVKIVENRTVILS